MATVRFDAARRWYPGADEPAVPGISLEVDDGELLVLVGPSGCGKSTALRMLAGLEEVDGGRIYLDGRDITHVPPRDRDVAMLFQNYALYPHMSVADNMGFALKMGRVPADERLRRVQEAARILGLTGHLDRLPEALSGAQRHRVAVGRAIVRRPQVFCMDEPLSNLDEDMRVQTRAELVEVQAQLGVTTVYGTADQAEAMTVGHRVAVMKDGDLQQVDTPSRVHDAPANLFVAGFIGSPRMNLIEARARQGRAEIGGHHLPVDPRAAATLPGSITVGVRPEAWRLVGDDQEGLPVRVTGVDDLGTADALVHGTCDVDGAPSTLTIRVGGRSRPQQGETIHVTADARHVHVFDTATGKRLPA